MGWWLRVQVQHCKLTVSNRLRHTRAAGTARTRVLVNPIGQDKAQEGHWNQHGESRRVQHRHKHCVQNQRVASFNLERQPFIQLIHLSLQKAPSYLQIFPTQQWHGAPEW